jgi:D-alanyl-D-alanine carboxypeptidase
VIGLVTLLAASQASALSATAGSDPLVPGVSTGGNPPACVIADRTARFTATADWSRTMVDWINRVPSTYRPPHLVPVSLAGLSGGGSVRAELIPDLRAMAIAARAAGAPLAVSSAYRSYSNQVTTFGYWVARYGYASAIFGSARRGHSEHQLGTTIDFRSLGRGDPWGIRGFDWATTRAGRWMMLNGWKYGFVMSYPKGKKAQVCYGYEPWHYRYFGRTVARAIQLSGLTTRVWLWRHGNSPALPPTPTPTPLPSAIAAPSSEPPVTASESPGSSPTDTGAPSPAPPSAPSTSDPSSTPDPSPTSDPSSTPLPSLPPEASDVVPSASG